MIAIKLDQKDYQRVMKALRKVRQKANFQFVTRGGEMNRKCAIGYAQMLVRNIMSLKRPSPLYVPRYHAWKKKYGRMGYPAPWRLFGDLVANISNFRDGPGWMGGIQAGIFDTGNKSWLGKGDTGESKEIAMYARVGEFGGKLPRGGGDHPARPVFRPTMEEYAQAEWPKQGGIALKEVGRSWR